MSQQSEFEYSEQVHREGRAMNTDPREQSQPYQPDYVGAQPMGGQKIYPQGPRPRRRHRWLWTLVIIVVIMALLGGFGGLSNTVFSRTTALQQHSFTGLTATPQLVVHDSAGSVTIHTGDTNSVVVSATEHTGLFSDPNAVQYKVGQTGNTIEVDVNEPSASFLSFGRVDLNITLPSTSNIQATVNAGSIDVNGVSGQMDIKADAGTVNFENGTISGNSNFEANAGTINFNGELAPNGNYTFQANAGTINITLPADSAFILDATANAGSVNNDFGSNTVGSNPTSHVQAHANAGTVNIRKK